MIDQHFMLQKEVVDRMVAPPGSKMYGRLSVMLQVRYRLTKLFNVPRGAFNPPPKVTSSIVRTAPLPAAELPAVDFGLFGRAVAAAFNQRRKILEVVGRARRARGVPHGSCSNTSSAAPGRQRRPSTGCGSWLSTATCTSSSGDWRSPH